MAEDYIRCGRNLNGTESCNKKKHRYLSLYLPYSKQAYKIQVIKEEDGEGIVLNQKELLTYEQIKESESYFEGLNCHSMLRDTM